MLRVFLNVVSDAILINDQNKYYAKLLSRMSPTLLIIDDDAKLNQLLKDFLKDFGYAVVTATHPARGLKKLKQTSPDLVILDIMLPDMVLRSAGRYGRQATFRSSC